MMSFLRCNFLLGILFFVACMVVGVSATEDPIIIESGDYMVKVNPVAAWTPSGIYYKGTQVGLGNGFYGAVFWEKTGQFVGTGHAEGGAEIVSSVNIVVDGVSKGVPVPGETYSGKEITFTKKSKLNLLDENWTLIVSADDGITEKLGLMATDDQYMEGIYAFMHPLFTNTVLWMAGNGTNIYSGECRSDNDWELCKEIKWVTLYSVKDNIGVLVSYPEVYSAKKIKTGIWDLDRYHKLYFQPMATEILTKGNSRFWEMKFICYQAGSNNWQNTAENIEKKCWVASPSN